MLKYVYLKYNLSSKSKNYYTQQNPTSTSNAYFSHTRKIE